MLFVEVLAMSNTETNRIEYKRELNEKLERSVVAFLNYPGGGELLLGVDNNGVPVGLADAELWFPAARRNHITFAARA